jgi:hypothetical protein
VQMTVQHLCRRVAVLDDSADGLGSSSLEAADSRSPIMVCKCRVLLDKTGGVDLWTFFLWNGRLAIRCRLTDISDH